MSDRIEDLRPRIEYRPASNEAERRSIFRLRHDAYLREGAIAAQPDGLFRDPADEDENTHLFGIYVDDVLASSIRLSIATRRRPDIPSGHVFADVIGPQIEAGKVVVDPTRFCADHARSRLHPELPYVTLRLAWLAMEHLEADILLAAVRPEHASFYRRFWNTRPVTEPRTYPPLAKPIVLTVSDYEPSRAIVEARYPFLASTETERAAIFGSVHSYDEGAFHPKQDGGGLYALA